MIELQENKRQILKKSAAKVSSANDKEINWDDVADLAGYSNWDSKNPGNSHNFSIFFQVNHNLFWTRYFFKVHLIELQENKRQILKKRAAEVSSANDEEINWDDVADLAGNSNSDSKNPGKDIPDDVQDKLLSEYEKELIEAKVKKVDQNLKTQLKIKEKQTSPDKGEFRD